MRGTTPLHPSLRAELCLHAPCHLCFNQKNLPSPMHRAASRSSLPKPVQQPVSLPSSSQSCHLLLQTLETPGNHPCILLHLGLNSLKQFSLPPAPQYQRCFPPQAHLCSHGSPRGKDTGPIPCILSLELGASQCTFPITLPVP